MFCIEETHKTSTRTSSILFNELHPSMRQKQESCTTKHNSICLFSNSNLYGNHHTLSFPQCFHSSSQCSLHDESLTSSLYLLFLKITCPSHFVYLLYRKSPKGKQDRDTDKDRDREIKRNIFPLYTPNSETFVFLKLHPLYSKWRSCSHSAPHFIM